MQWYAFLLFAIFGPHMYDVLHKHSHTHTHTRIHAHFTHTLLLVVGLFSAHATTDWICWNERTNETNEEWQQEGNAFEDFRHFSRTLPFHSFSFAFVFVLLCMFWSSFFYTFFVVAAAVAALFLKSQKKWRTKLGRFHCINERKYAHLDERREYLNDSGFLPPLPMRNEALQMNYHFYVTQYVCVRVSVCMSSEDQNASFESWKLRTEREGERGKGIVVNLQHNTNIVFVRILSFRIHSFSVYSFFLFRLTEIITDHRKEWTYTHTPREKRNKNQTKNEKKKVLWMGNRAAISRQHRWKLLVIFFLLFRIYWNEYTQCTHHIESIRYTLRMEIESRANKDEQHTHSIYNKIRK